MKYSRVDAKAAAPKRSRYTASWTLDKTYVEAVAAEIGRVLTQAGRPVTADEIVEASAWLRSRDNVWALLWRFRSEGLVRGTWGFFRGREAIFWAPAASTEVAA